MGEELFAPYVALAQSVEDRRRELLSRFPSADGGGGGEGGGGGGDGGGDGVCCCPRCLLEAGGDRRLLGREMLKVG